MIDTQAQYEAGSVPEAFFDMLITRLYFICHVMKDLYAINGSRLQDSSG